MSNHSNYFPSVNVRDVYTPAMMQFDGSGDYYAISGKSVSANVITFVGVINAESFTGNALAIPFGGGSGSDTAFTIFLGSSDYTSDSAYQNRALFHVSKTGGTLICALTTNVDVCDGEDHAILFAYDATNGTAVLYVDGVDADNTSWGSRIVSIDTITTTSSAWASAVAWWDLASRPYTGKIGFVGCGGVYETDYTKFFDSNNRPRPLDETTWTEWGSQPYVWNEHGDLANNKGSFGNFTRSGTPVVDDEEVVQTGYRSLAHQYTVINPGCETGDMTGWTTETGTGFEARASGTSGINARTGTYLFYAGSQLEARSYQDITAIAGVFKDFHFDNESVLLKMVYYAGSYNNNDRTRMYFSFLDASDVEITTYQTKEALVAGPALDWERREIIAIAPKGTRKIRIHMHGYRYDGTGNNAHIDDIELHGQLIA